MLFIENKKDPSKSYLECGRNFKPSGKNIDIGIDGEISGPTVNQIDFFKTIENKYLESHEKLREKPFIS